MGGRVCFVHVEVFVKCKEDSLDNESDGAFVWLDGNPLMVKFGGDHHGEFFNLGCQDKYCAARWIFYTLDISEKDTAVEQWNRRVT